MGLSQRFVVQGVHSDSISGFLVLKVNFTALLHRFDLRFCQVPDVSRRYHLLVARP